MALASSPEQPRPLREIASAVKGWVERLGAVWVSAQVIALNRKSGSIHFLTLRDTLTEVSVSVTASTSVLDSAGPLNEGMEVVAYVKPAVWLATGRLSFECYDLRPTGEGRLLAEIEQRKRRLQAEGLFDPARKRPLPVLPRRIGLVTAQGSAAERDVVVNVALRWPAAQIDVRHCLMQGPKSAEQVAQAVYELDLTPDVDVIVVARGGGSVEDLLPFSDEHLARVVAAAQTPVVSAIGHETDTPILDLVADLRASTPTDAAKRIVPDAAGELSHVTSARHQMRRAVLNQIEARLAEVDALRSRPVMRDPLGGYSVLEAQVAHHVERLRAALGHRLDTAALEVGHLIAQVRTMSPKATLERGYAILLTEAGVTLTDPAEAAPGDAVTAFLKAGTLGLVVASDASDASDGAAAPDGPATTQAPTGETTETVTAVSTAETTEPTRTAETATTAEGPRHDRGSHHPRLLSRPDGRQLRTRARRPDRGRPPTGVGDGEPG